MKLFFFFSEKQLKVDMGSRNSDRFVLEYFYFSAVNHFVTLCFWPKTSNQNVMHVFLI